MNTHTYVSTVLPFELGEARSFGGLTVVPLFADAEPSVEYVGLDEAVAGGVVVSEVSDAGAVESLLVANPLGTAVLLYEGEELAGAKQNRVLERSILVGAGSKIEIPAKCVEAGRWAYRSRRFAPAPRAAYPELRRLRHDLGVPSQRQVWAEVDAKAARLEAVSADPCGRGAVRATGCLPRRVSAGASAPGRAGGRDRRDRRRARLPGLRQPLGRSLPACT